MQTALRLLYPFKPQQQLADIAACIEAGCSSSRTAASSAKSTGTAGSIVPPQALATVVAAIRQAAGSTGCILAQQPAEAQGCCEAAAVVECVLQQHLQALLSYAQQTLQQVQQLLAQQPVSDAGAGAAMLHQDAQELLFVEGGKLLQQLAALLASYCSCNSSNSSSCGGSSKPGFESRQPSLNARQQQAATGESVAELGSRLGSRGGSSRYSSSGGGSTNAVAAAGVGEAPLIAAASAARTLQPGGSSRRYGRGEAPEAAATAAAAASSSDVCSVHSWLAALQRCQNGSSSSSSKLEVQQLLCWLQRECLLQPASCQQDVASAVRWCKTAAHQ
jgi:hypothetical protein